jgi:hypothetical protein
MATVHKKKKEVKKSSSAKIEVKKTEEQKPNEEVVVSDVITEVIQVAEKPISEPVKSEASTGASFSADPLGEFKEKMIEEELDVPGVPQKKNFMWPILLIFIIAIALLVGVFVYRQGLFQGLFKKEKINVATVTPAPTAIPEPTKAADLTKYEIEILNGGGVSGEASRQKATLEKEGFTISSIGNAENSNYTDTIIQAKSTVEKAFLNKLKETLGATFTVGKTEALADDSSVPVIVILGAKK